MPNLALPLAFTKCRTWGHMWDDYHPHGKRPPGWGTRFSLRCERCGTERHDTIDSLGELSAREYVYPDEYHLASADTPTRQALRLELLRTMRKGVRNGNQRKVS
jgi:hypothetical protein